MIDLQRIGDLVRSARAAGRLHVEEPAARSLLEAMGVAVPGAVFVRPGEAPGPACARLAGERVVVRVVAEAIQHKTEVGGVEVVAREEGAVADAMARMQDRLGQGIEGFVLAEFVAHDAGLGGSLLVSARWTDDAGPVVSVGAGGVDAEALAADLAPGSSIAILSPALTPRHAIPALLREVTAVRLATEPQRGRPPRVPMIQLVDVVHRFLSLAGATMPGELLELEVNPLVVSDGRLVALDALVTLWSGPEVPLLQRPTHKLARLLRPRSAAIAGVSSGMNAGRVILRNMLRDGFDPAAITVIKPGVDEIDGCRCVPDIASLPGKVDLLVVALAARQSAETVADAIERDAAESIVLIAGGLEEKQGTDEIVRRMHDALAASRGRPDGGPLVNGGNCLGVRSVPGRYDTLFIPGWKLRPPAGSAAPLAIIAQSGAFAITRLGRLADLHPAYVVTVGNQMDLTVGDYLEHLADDPSISVFGVYVEGFRPRDAGRLVAAARRIGDRGGTVVLSLAGRTAAGARASASHTASIAGDRAVVRELARQAGVIVVETLDAFDDVLRTATMLVGRPVKGRRLGAISNAGFECVAIADAATTLLLDPFDAATGAQLGTRLAELGVGAVVDVHNPLDVTPMAGDAAFAALTEAVLASDDVDVAVVGVVPLTAELATLAPGPGYAEDAGGPDAIAARLLALWRRTTKPWVVVVDAGALYDPFVAGLEVGGIPVFRTADRAVRALEAVVEQRLRPRD
jgi:acyl-CoA synthetase (NDP forming)